MSSLPGVLRAARQFAFLSLITPSMAFAAGQTQSDQGQKPPPEAERAILRAIAKAEKAQGHDKSAPAKPLGEPGAFFGADSYPPEAIRLHQQGRVFVRIEIDARGVPVGCVVVTSSGSPSLDEATCGIATTRMQFSPAKDQNGRPIATVYPQSVKWVLPTDLPPPAVDLSNGRVQVADSIVRFDVDENGMATACKVVLKPETFPDLCGGFKPGGTPYPAARIAERPSRSVVTIETTVMSDRPDP